ncbi:MAG: DUF2157 domain-containing protein, partial [Bacillota bacterium]|nr:DUF2157 domain-containing protein [Bacillota bacterium]
YYLAVLVFGAGIFLIGQMFHFGGDFQDAFIWWSLGIMPLALVLRDKWILLAASLFVLLYMTNNPYMSGHTIPYWTILWMATLYVLNNKIGFSRATAFVTALLPLVFMAIVFNSFFHENNDYYYVLGLLYVAIGAGLVTVRNKIKEVYVVLGHLVHGIAALTLSFQSAWPENWMYLPFSIVYILFVLYLINRGSLLSIIILCAMIFRFYIDLSFEFLPKSFVFIIGGLLLLGFGFYFEKQRKKGGRVHE